MTAPQVIPLDPDTPATGPVDSGTPVSSDPAGGPGGPGQDTPAIAVGHDLPGTAANLAFPGFQGTAIREPGLARLRIPWQKLAKLIVPRLRVSKVPPAAR